MKYQVMINNGVEAFAIAELADLVTYLEEHLVERGERQVTVRVDAIIIDRKRADGVDEKAIAEKERLARGPIGVPERKPKPVEAPPAPESEAADEDDDEDDEPATKRRAAPHRGKKVR
jgi:hypothetical protein